MIDEDYHDHETIGKLTIRKTGPVLTGWEEENSDLLDPQYSGEAWPGHFVYEPRPLAGAEYTITANEDIFTGDHQVDADGNRTLWYAKGDVVAVVQTGDGTSDIVTFAPGRTNSTYDFLSVIHDGSVGEVTKARIIAYDIRELGEQLMPLGMLVTLDAIYNRVIQNWKRGHRTWIFCDEFYILFRYEYSANFFYKLWKRIRKYNGLITGMTQNVDELLRSDTARLMLANSEFLIMLNQSATDREELAKLLNISDTQLGYITNVPAGCGLIRCAGNLVPFTNSFPRDTQLYRLMTTKPDEQLKG